MTNTKKTDTPGMTAGELIAALQTFPTETKIHRADATWGPEVIESILVDPDSGEVTLF